jgi:hypothetical protein
MYQEADLPVWMTKAPFMFTEELSWETLAKSNGKTNNHTTADSSPICYVLQ